MAKSEFWQSVVETKPVADPYANLVCRVCLSPDGSRFATYASPIYGDDFDSWQENAIRVWNAANGRRVRLLKGHEGAVTGAAFSADSRYLVSSSADGTVRSWDPKGGAQLKLLQVQGQIQPNGTIISYDEDETLRITDAASGETLRDLHIPGGIESIDATADAGCVVEGRQNGGLRVWDHNSDARVLRGGGSIIFDVIVSNDGKRVLAAAWEGVQVWDITSGKQISLMKFGDHSVTHIELSADGRRVFAALHNGPLTIRDIETGKDMMVPGFNVRSSFSTSADGSRVAVIGSLNEVTIWDEEVRPRSGLRGLLGRLGLSR